MNIEGNIVKDYHSGNTHILVADDYYKNMTEEDVARKLKDIADIVQRAKYAASSQRSDNNME